MPTGATAEFKSSLALHISFLPVIKRNMLESPTMIVDLSIYPCCSVGFCFCVF